MGNRWGGSGNSVRLFLGSKITADGDCSHEIKRRLFLGRKVMTNLDSILKSRDRRSQDGGRIGRGDHFLPYKFIERTIQRRANLTKQLLITSWGHQVPRKAAHCLWNIKDKKRDKRARDGDPSREGSLNRGSFQSPGNPPTGGSGGSFRISEGNLTGRKINKTHRLRAEKYSQQKSTPDALIHHQQEGAERRGEGSIA